MTSSSFLTHSKPDKKKQEKICLQDASCLGDLFQVTAAKATMRCRCCGRTSFQSVAEIGVLLAGAVVRTCDPTALCALAALMADTKSIQ